MIKKVSTNTHTSMTDKATDKQVGGNHYKDFAIQPIEFIHANKIPFIEGAVIKYVCRHRGKNGVQDIDKAIHFLEMLKQFEYGEQEQDGKMLEYKHDEDGWVTKVSLKKLNEWWRKIHSYDLNGTEKDIQFLMWCYLTNLEIIDTDGSFYETRPRGSGKQ